jgi:lysophospholipase L1-like esterase
VRVLIFGDSITQGMWDSQGGWAQRLIDEYFAEQMRDLEADLPVLFNLGVSADTTVELLQRFQPETKARLRTGEMAFVFAIGTNDSRVDGKAPFSTPEQYAANIESLITQVQQFAPKDKLLFVGLQPCDEARTTPVSWRDVTYSNERLELFDRALHDVCTKQGVVYVPIFDAFQKRQAEQAILNDGLHPNDEGHELMYKLISPAVKLLTGS